MSEILDNIAILCALIAKVAIYTGIGPGIVLVAIVWRLRGAVVPIRKLPKPIPFPSPNRKPPRRAESLRSPGIPPAA